MSSFATFVISVISAGLTRAGRKRKESMRERRYVIEPDAAVLSKRYRRRAYGHETNAIVEARAVAQETMLPVKVFRRDGLTRVLIKIITPKSQIQRLLEEKQRLETALGRVNEMLSRRQTE
jgi:hypothetical protein